MRSPCLPDGNSVVPDSPPVPTNPLTGLPDPGLKTFVTTVASYLNQGSAALSISDAFIKGDLASGLVSSLSVVLSKIASNYSQDSALEYSVAADVFAGPGYDPGTTSIDAERIFGINPDGVAESSGFLLSGFPDAPNASAYKSGTASSPGSNALILPPTPGNNGTPVNVTRDDGTQITGGSGDPLVAPPGFPTKYFIERGRADASDPTIAGQYQRATTVLNSPDFLARVGSEASLALTTPLGFFGPRGLWDVQSYVSPTGFATYTDFANFAIGEYAAAAGIPLTTILRINDDATSTIHLFKPLPLVGGKPQLLDHVYTSMPAANVTSIQRGYEAVISGHIQ